jgi:TldD protein
MEYKGLERHSSRFRGYTELRVQENREAVIVLANGDVLQNRGLVTGGSSARAYKGGVWGFASNPATDDAAIARVVGIATSNARFLAGKEGRGEVDLPCRPGSGSFDYSMARPRAGQKELMEFVKAIDARIAERHKGLCARSVRLRGLDMEKTMLASDGGSGYSMTPQVMLYVEMTVEAGPDTVNVHKVFGGLGRFEDWFGEPAALFESIEEAHDHLMRKAQGVHAEAGLHEVVLGPELAGILAHEAIGHTVEADLVLGGSVAGENLGRKVASEIVTLVDYAHTAKGRICPVPVHVDDEGTEARDVVLIEDGVLRNFMHNKETAGHFGVEPMGNARAHEFSDEPLVRMRNTAIDPGTSSLDDMISDVQDGYYLIRPSNGQADSTSEFMFGVVLGYEIKRGKIGRAIRDVTISGVAFDMLKTVTALSKDMTWVSGMCGKKQLIPVGMGGPALRCQVMIGGRL